jgi:hypothetical protein
MPRSFQATRWGENAMSEQHAINRYADARERLEFADKHLKEAGNLLAKTGLSLQSRPMRLPVEGIGSWQAIANNPDTLRKDSWPDFDRLKSMVENYLHAMEDEAKAWNELSPQHKQLIKRG